jgi:hypothetical protein
MAARQARMTYRRGVARPGAELRLRIAKHPALRATKRRDFLALLLQHLGPDDDIDVAGLVLGGRKDDACRPWRSSWARLARSDTVVN